MLGPIDIEDFVLCARYGEYEEMKQVLDMYAATLSEAEKTQQIRQLLIQPNSTMNISLHYAAANGHLDIMNLILPYLSPDDVNLQNDGGNTPLHWAALNGSKPTIELLLKHGANATIKNLQGKTAVFEAEQQDHQEVVALLLTSFEPLESDDDEDDDMPMPEEVQVEVEYVQHQPEK